MTCCESILQGQVDRIWLGMHRPKLASKEAQLVPCTPYRAGPSVKEFEKMEIDERLKMRVVKQSRT